MKAPFVRRGAARTASTRYVGSERLPRLRGNAVGVEGGEARIDEPGALEAGAHGLAREAEVSRARRLAQRAVAVRLELDEDDAAARLHDPAELGEGVGGLREVAQEVEREDGVERRVRERQALGRGLPDGHVREAGAADLLAGEARPSARSSRPRGPRRRPTRGRACRRPVPQPTSATAEAARDELEERGLADARRVERPLDPVPLPRRRRRIRPRATRRSRSSRTSLRRSSSAGNAASVTAPDDGLPELRARGGRGVALRSVRPPGLHETRVAEDREVVRDARLGGLEDPLDLADLQLLLREEPHGPQAEGVRERGERGGGVQHPAAYITESDFA